MKDMLSVGIVGCGRIFSRHAQAVASTDRLLLRAVCDSNKTKAYAAAAAYGNTIPYTDFAYMLQDADLDIVHISTPSGLHYNMTIDCLRAGKHVVLEKPATLSVQHIEDLIFAEKESGCSVMPVLQNRLNPAVVFLRKHMHRLGPLKQIAAQCFWYRPQSYYDDGWHGSRHMDGGVLYNQGVHFIDMMYYLFNKRPIRVSALGGTFCHEMESEDAASVNIQFEQGVIGSLQINTISYPENLEGSLLLFFERASIKIGGMAMNEIVYWKGEGAELEKECAQIKISDVYGAGHMEVVRNMRDMLFYGEEPYVTLEGAAVAIRIIEAAHESMRTHTVVHL